MPELTNIPFDAAMIPVFLVSLGCDKNRVDSEIMLGLLRDAGHTLAPDEAKAAVIVVNTCGFIRDAVQEGIETILSMAENKQTGMCKKLIVTGCMAQRYREEILNEIPEVDAILGVSEYPALAGVVRDLWNGGAAVTQVKDMADNSFALDNEDLYKHRLAAAHSHVAYVKIAEGCDNRCTYCAIPHIRGPYRSRSFEGILEECARLVSQGARELVLVAQDTARYGSDRYGRPRLHELLQEISALEGLTWVRIMYAYPEHITGELIETLRDYPKVCKYIDMPIQHSHDGVLHRMGRRSTLEGLREVIARLRERVPGIILRTTLMVGFPGETDEEFDALCQFVQDMRFDRLGVFAYSREDGTPAARMKSQVKSSVKKARRDILMRLQQAIFMEKQRALIGQTVSVMVDGLTDGEAGQWVYSGRSHRDAPEVDSVVLIKSPVMLAPGEVAAVRVTGLDGYDLQGDLVHEFAQ